MWTMVGLLGILSLPLWVVGFVLDRREGTQSLRQLALGMTALAVILLLVQLIRLIF